MKTRFDWVGPGLVIAGRYRIEAPLGEGGYGAVFVATQNNLDRRVALKLLHPEVLVRERARDRFAREARVTQKLSHPNIVRLFDFGTSEQGLPFIVCELLEGRSLEQELRTRGPFSPARAAHVAQQILKALADAHAHGIVHRDVKPANIFLCDYAGEPDFVKVLDFGIAAAPLENGTGGLTQEGVSLGTPAYMSPEQVLDQPLDGRADLYSLGLVMSEMLTGTPVYEGAVAMQVALKQIEAAPVPLPRAVLDGPLGAFIGRATQKETSHRYASALEMLEALRASAVGQPSGPQMYAPYQGARAAHTPPTPQPTYPAASSASMPFAAPLAKAQPSKPGRAVYVVAAVAAAIAIAATTYAITISTTTTGKQRKDAKPSAAAQEEEEDWEASFDREVAQYEQEILKNVLKNPALTCSPLPPKVSAFAVKGLTVADAIGRAEAGGYQCMNHTSLTEDSGTLTFIKDIEPGFQLFYTGNTLAPMADKFPQSVTLADPDAKRYFVVMTVDQNIETAKKIGQLLVTPTAKPAAKP